MNTEEFEQQALNYLKRKLNSQEEKAILHVIEEDVAKKQHFEELKRIWNATTADQMETPDEALRKGFYNMLAMHQFEAEKPKFVLQKFESFLNDLTQYKRIGQFAMVFTISLVSGFIGFQFNSNSSQQELQSYAQKVENLNTELATVQLKSNSTSDRIQAVNTLGSINLNEDVIVKKLVNKLLYDDNLHVRMAAGKSLLAFKTNAVVLPAIIKAIRTETELLVQATLIDVLITLDKDIAIKEIYRIYESESSSPELRTIYQSILESENI